MFGEGDMYASASPEGTEAPAQAGEQPSLSFPEQAPESVAAVAPLLSELRDTVKNLNKPKRRIVEIRVFFDDDTFEIFSPS